MSEVNKQVNIYTPARDVVDTACTLDDIRHDDHVYGSAICRTEISDDLGNDRRKDVQPIGELQCNPRAIQSAHTVDYFVHFEVVIRG